ncbi:tetratricopeptide repeat protein [Candidatus Sumerlaeota bacterium]|nr:tetratricopeptide repeat protein [Candidatus Sumerlaeota bacterium]
MSDEFPHRPVVALFPFALGVQEPVTPRDADLCRGFANFIDRRFSQITGIEIVLQNLFITPENNRSRRGWLMTNAYWTHDQIMNLPHAANGEFSHALQGQLLWRNEQFEGSLQLLDLFDGDVLLDDAVSGTVATALPRFFTLLGHAASLITNSESAGRIAARRPTASFPAFENYLLALAAQHAFQHGMVSAEPAALHFSKALELDPDFRTAAEELENFASDCFRNEHGNTEAMAALERIVQASPDTHPRLSALYAIELARHGREHDRALSLMESYVERERHGALASRAFAGMGEIHRQRNHLARARASLRAATIANPDDAGAWETLGRYHSDAGDIALAENCWKRALQEDPRRTAPLYLLAESHSQRGDHPTALLFLEQLLQSQDAPSHNARILHIGTLSSLGRDADADAVATTFAEENPRDHEAWLALFETRMALDDHAGAAYCLQRCGALEPTSHQREKLQLRQMRLASQEDFTTYRTLADTKDHSPLTVDELTQLTERHPDVIALARLQAKALADTNRHAESIPLLRKLAAFHKDDADAQRALATAHERNGDLTAAIETLSIALQLHPGDSETHERLQHLLRHQASPAGRQEDRAQPGTPVANGKTTRVVSRVFRTFVSGSGPRAGRG